MRGDTENGALRAVRELLRDWAKWKRNWRPGALGYAHAVSFIDQVHGTIDSYCDGDDYDDRISAWQVKAVDRAVDDLRPDQRVAVCFVYFREDAPSRINGWSRADLHALCNAGELALIPLLRRRNVVL